MNIYKAVQDSKTAGMNYSEIAAALSISRNSVRKYARMSEAEYERYRKRLLRRGMRFDPYQAEILSIFSQNDPSKITASSIFDVLEEAHGALPANERSLRNYLQFLDAEGLLPTQGSHRQYLPVEQLPSGRQLQLDFGEEKLISGARAYLFCAILSHSRYRYVAVQDHPFSTREVIEHLLDCFLFIGGRPEELVIDQDRLMVVSENAGDIITTRDFGDFICEQELFLFVCRKADPESKGKVENLVKFVKTSFFSARAFQEVTEIPAKLSQWLARRANGKLCQATRQIPAEVHKTEREHLRPLKPSVYLAAHPMNRDVRTADEKGDISVAGSLYSVPREYRGLDVEIYLTESELLIFDKVTHERVACHARALVPGTRVVQKSHRLQTSGATDALLIELAARFPFPEWSQFLAENQRHFRRYRREQARALLKVVEENDTPSPEILQNALGLCLEAGTVSAANLSEALAYFREVREEGAPDVLSLVKGRCRVDHAGGMVTVAKRKPSYYSSILLFLGAVA